jgi:hypothetical protein
MILELSLPHLSSEAKAAQGTKRARFELLKEDRSTVDSLKLKVKLADARGENAEPNDRELSLQEERWAIWRYW